jgi:hypothetical protein
VIAQLLGRSRETIGEACKDFERVVATERVSSPFPIMCWPNATGGSH